MSKLSNVFDLVSVLSSHPGEFQAFQRDPMAIIEKYGLSGKIGKEEIQEILDSKSLQKHGEFVARSITIIECPNAGT